jgi:hypothetical protein
MSLQDFVDVNIQHTSYRRAVFSSIEQQKKTASFRHFERSEKSGCFLLPPPLACHSELCEEPGCFFFYHAVPCEEPCCFAFIAPTRLCVVA